MYQPEAMFLPELMNVIIVEIKLKYLLLLLYLHVRNVNMAIGK